MVNTHGLATSIRSAQESETFDLGGQNVSTITSTMEAAFAEPFDHSNFSNEPGGMIRLTFVTGAGKQARAKYDDGAAKALIAVLTKFGYSEDRGASCVVECSGTYKQQHDTGKNLKTVVVFPKIGKNSSSSNFDDNTLDDSTFEPIIPTNSAGYKIATASMRVFENMISSRCPSWSDKKGALDSLEGLQNILQSFENKLMNGTPLEADEQQFYDAVAMLSDKETYVKGQMHAQVEEGDITAYEKDFLLHQVQQRIQQLKKDGKATQKVQERQTMLQNIDPIDPHPLKYESQISALRKELVPLLQMEASSKGRLLSIKETQTLSRKDEIEEEIDHLEQESQGWFESDESFLARLEASRRKWSSISSNGRKRSNAKGNTSSKGGAVGKNKATDAGGSSRATNWVSYSEAAKGGWQQRQQKEARKTRDRMRGKNGRAGDVFGAMMMDDSDGSTSEDDNSLGQNESGDEKDTTSGDKKRVGQSASKSTNERSTNPSMEVKTKTDAEGGGSEPPSKKKKKNKKKKKKATTQSESDGAVKTNDQSEVKSKSASQAKNKATADPSTADESSLVTTALHLGKIVAVALYRIARDYLVPMLLSLLTWLIAQLTGKKKGKANAKGRKQEKTQTRK